MQLHVFLPSTVWQFLESHDSWVNGDGICSQRPLCLLTDTISIFVVVLMGCVHGKCARSHGSSSQKCSVEGKVKFKGKGVADEVPNHPKEIHTCYRIHTSLKKNPNGHFFGVFDGHGQCGEYCEEFVKKRLSKILLKESLLSMDTISAYHSTFQATNEKL